MVDVAIRHDGSVTSLEYGGDSVLLVDGNKNTDEIAHKKSQLVVDKNTREILGGELKTKVIEQLIGELTKQLKNNEIDRSYGEDIFNLLNYLQGNYYTYMEKLYTDIDTAEGHVWNLDDKMEYRQRLIEQQKIASSTEDDIVTLPELKKASLSLKRLYIDKNSLEEQVKGYKRQEYLFSQASIFLEQYEAADTATQKSLERKYNRYVKKCMKQGCSTFDQLSLQQKAKESSTTLGLLTNQTEQYYTKIAEQTEVYNSLKHTVLFSNPVDIETTSKIFEHDQHIVALQEQRNELKKIYQELLAQQDDLITPFFILYELHKEKSIISNNHRKILNQGKKLLEKDATLKDKQNARKGNAISSDLQRGYTQLSNIKDKISEAKGRYHDTSGGRLYADRSKKMKEKFPEMKQIANQVQGRIRQIQNDLGKKRKKVAGLHKSNRQLIADFEKKYTTTQTEQAPVDVPALRKDIEIFSQQKELYLEQLTRLQEKLHKEITFFMKKQGLDHQQKAYLVEYLHRIPALHSQIDEMIDLLYTYKDHLKPTKIDNMRHTQRTGIDLGNEYYTLSTDKDKLAKTWIEERIVYDEDDITERENDLYTDFDELTDAGRNQPDYRVVYDIKGKTVPLSTEVRDIGEVLFSVRDKVLQQHIHVDEFMQTLSKLEPQITTAIASLDQQHETPYKLMKNACKAYIAFIHKAKHFLTSTDYGKFLLLRSKVENTYAHLEVSNDNLTGLQNTKEPRLPDFSLDDVSIIVPRTRNKREKPAISQIGTVIQQMRSYKQGWEIQEKMLKNAVKVLEEDMHSYKGYT